MQNYHIHSIGKVCINEKGMFLQLQPDYIPALQALDGFSHLAVLWWCSDFDNPNMRQIVEMTKPYKNAPEKMGTFATRSPIRPNPIGLTMVQVIYVDYANGLIQLAYIDANNNTPIIDIKPYTPSFDRIENPKVPAWCQHWPNSLEQSASFDWENEFVY